MYNLNIEAHLCKHCCHGKADSIKYYKCGSILALGIQHADHIFSALYYSSSVA